jgi:nonsense-mediated mRNA decay protein 3
VGVKEAPDGLDFFYGNRSHALKMVDFLGSVVAIRSRADKQLVGADHSSNTYNYKHTFCVEIAPVCKEDLVCLPLRVHTALGALGPVLLCVRVSNQLTLMDVATLRTAHADATAYYRAPYRPMLTARQLVEFVVLDIEPLAAPQGRWQLAEAQVARVSDFGRNDAVFFARTHLGNLLHPGDTCLGYDLAGANLSEPELERYKALQLPDVLLVRKSYAARRRARREKGTAPQRAWALRRLPVFGPDDGPAAESERQRPGAAGAGERRVAEEEAFLEELEEDAELRARVALYRVRHGAGGEGEARRSSMGVDDDGEEIPEVPLEELLDELALGGGGDDDEELEMEE